jgi:hypothetical protein
MDPKALDATKDVKVNRVSAEEADYMELSGAEKDADCEKVEVDGGVSSALGCCNLFEPAEASTKKFSCGTCEYKR